MKTNRKLPSLSLSRSDEMQRLSEYRGFQPSKRSISWFFKMARQENLGGNEIDNVLSSLYSLLDEMESTKAEMEAEIQLIKGCKALLEAKRGNDNERLVNISRF